MEVNLENINKAKTIGIVPIVFIGNTTGFEETKEIISCKKDIFIFFKS